MTKEIRRLETRTSGSGVAAFHRAFGFRYSFGICHSSFVISRRPTSTATILEHTLRMKGGIAVGTPVARRPPHRSRRAVFPHRALQDDSLTHAPPDNAPQTV